MDGAGVISLVADIYPGSEGSFLGHPEFAVSPNWFTATAGSGLLFFAEDGTHGRELWATDGTAAGTLMVKDTEPGPGGSDLGLGWITPGPGSSYLFAATNTATGKELWTSDLTEAGTHIVAEVEGASFTGNGAISFLNSANGVSLFFAGNDGTPGGELYGWDPVQGLQVLQDDEPGDSSFLAGAVSRHWLGNQEVGLFSGNVPGTGAELWVTDGSPGGTHSLKDLLPGPSSSHPLNFTTLGKSVVFVATAPSAGRELWKTNGTDLGTSRLAEVQPGLGSASFPTGLHAYQGKVYLRGDDGVLGRELWVSDGTTNGTFMLMDIHPGGSGSFPQYFTEYNGLLYFVASDGIHGNELWSTDGSVGNTALVTDLRLGSAGSNPVELTVFKDKLYFRAQDSSVGTELFVSDGTAAGTGLFVDLRPGSGNGSPSSLTIADDVMYFAASNGVDGWELFKTDGTVAGTGMVRDLNSGPNDSMPEELIAAGGGVYFSADDGVSGRELWFSDGTAAGTVLVCDLAPGSMGSSPMDLTLASGSLFFRATSPSYGVELFHLPLAAPYVLDLGYGEDGVKLTATTPALGGPLTIAMEGAQPTDVSLLFRSLPVLTPSGAYTAGTTATWLDPNSAKIVQGFVGSSWSLTIGLPASPGLVGFQINLQSFLLPGGLWPGKTANGLSLVLGN